MKANGIQDAFADGLAKLEAQEAEATAEAPELATESVSNDAETISDTKTTEETSGEESTTQTPDEKLSETTDVEVKEKRRKHSLQDRINSKHAELMQTKELLSAEKAEKDALIRRIEALESSKQAPEVDTEEPELTVNDIVTKKGLDAMVSKLVQEQLVNAKDTYEQEAKTQSLKKMQNDFYSKMNEYYNPDRDPDYVLDPDVKDEAVQIIELFNGAPKRLLDLANKKGISYLRKFVSGELEAEQKAAKIKSIITKADAVKTNVDSNNNVEKAQGKSTAKSWRGFFDSTSKNLKGV